MIHALHHLPSKSRLFPFLHAPPLRSSETTKSVFHDATCGTMSYAHEDPLTAATALTRRSLRAWHFSDLQIDFKDGEVDKVWVSDTCWKQLPRIERQKEPSALVSSLSPRRNMRNDTCGFLDDVWFIISDTQGENSTAATLLLCKVGLHVLLFDSQHIRMNSLH